MANQIDNQIILVEAHYINCKEDGDQIQTHKKDKNGTRSWKNGVQNALENI